MPFSGRSYDPETLALMTRALDQAWGEAQASAAAAGLDEADTRKAMALLVMAAVDEGLRDPEHLKRIALGVIDARDAANGQ